MEKCVCGCKGFKTSGKGFYEVTPEGETVKAPKGQKLKIATCTECGVARQLEAPYTTPEELAAFYKKYKPTNKAYQTKTYDHDRRVAVIRCDNYSVKKGEKILDVGSGSGAFIDECRQRGTKAYGCEIAEYACAKNTKHVYQGRMEDINFPTDYFDRITCHDVLEHSLDPLALIKEMFRATKQEGMCIIEIPNFHHKSGKHHWKKEHIWFLKAGQLEDLMKEAGFEITATYIPIESKVVVCGYKPIQKRPKILLPPGIGDSYWSMIKLRSFLEREKLPLPDLHVVCNRDKWDGHKRAFPFLEMIPFAHSTGIIRESTNAPDNRKIWTEAYAQEGRTIFKNVMDCDYFLSYNGHLRVGTEMEDLDPDLNTEWNLPLFTSIEQDTYKIKCQKRFGKYIVFYFVFHGTYRYWKDEFPINPVINYAKKVTETTGCTPVFVGAKWDHENKDLNTIIDAVPGCVDLTGKTTVEQLFGVLRGSEMVVGYPSGLSIMSAALGIKTLIVWNDYYNREFVWNCAPPNTRRENYFIDNTKGLSAESLAARTIDVLEDKKPLERDFPPLQSNPSTRRSYKIPKANPEPKASSKPVANPPRSHRQPRNVERLSKRTPVVKPRTRSRVQVQERKPSTKPIQNPNTGPIPAMTITEQKLVIACVLKSGGNYDARHALKLKSMLDKNVTVPFDFVMFTDLEVEGIEGVELIKGLPGWWSKLELFRLTAGPVLYLDLDTLILKNIDKLATEAAKLQPNEFRMLIPFNEIRAQRGLWASGIMAWNGDFRFIPNNITPKQMKLDRGDQVFITTQLKVAGVVIRPVNEWVGVCSYKKQCVALGGPPKGTQIVCVHGRVGIESIQDVWVKEAWK